MAPWLRFVKLQVNKLQNFCNDNRHNGKVGTVWDCLVVTGPGHLTVMNSAMMSDVYQNILGSNVKPRLNLVM